MRSTPDDRTAKAAIRDEALRLFAELGPDAVTIRQIAAAAGVSPGLVLHHFGSKEGLRMAVDQKVSGIFDRLFDLAGDARETLLQAGAGASFAELLVGQLPPDSPIPAYLRRLMLAGDDASRALIQRWFESSRVMIDQMGAAGVIRTGDDPATLAAFLMVNDLAMILLRDQIRDVTGSDPLTVEGMSRWFESAVAVYRDGLFLPAEDPANQDPDSPDQTSQDPTSPDQRTEER